MLAYSYANLSSSCRLDLSTSVRYNVEIVKI